MENFEQLKETQLSSREIFNGRIMHVFEDTVRLPNGEAASREYMRHVATKSAVAFEGAVVELTLEEKEKALKDLVEQFGHGE